MPSPGLENPLFATDAIMAAPMILKAIAMSWLTVLRMMQVKGGYRSPEDRRRNRFDPVFRALVAAIAAWVARRDAADTTRSRRCYPRRRNGGRSRTVSVANRNTERHPWTSSSASSPACSP
jgi:hypothetical protein